MFIVNFLFIDLLIFLLLSVRKCVFGEGWLEKCVVVEWLLGMGMRRRIGFVFDLLCNSFYIFEFLGFYIWREWGWLVIDFFICENIYLFLFFIR